MSQSQFAPPLLAVAALLAATLPNLPHPAALTIPAIVTLAGLLLFPALRVETMPRRARAAVSAGWCAACGACTALALMLHGGSAPLAAAAAGTMLIVAAGSALWLLLDAPAAPGARWRFNAVLMLAVGAPLWAAPLAELYAPLSTAIACASPLSLLGVLVDYDYLRSAFFYRHSALGALAYRYPSDGVFAGMYAAAAAVLWLGALVSRRSSED